MEDGGYYAIKGFDFQIDKTIISLLRDSKPDEQVKIEQIQDLNTDSIVIQIKYKETQDFANSKIREPVVKLIDEFQQNGTINNMFSTVISRTKNRIRCHSHLPR